MIVLCFQKHYQQYKNRFFTQITSAKSICYGINSVFTTGLCWNSLLQSVKYNESILELKTKMKDLRNINDE